MHDNRQERWGNRFRLRMRRTTLEIGAILLCSVAGPRCECDFNMGTCGDGVADFLEQCDGADLRGHTCEDLGYVGGELMCNGNCFFAEGWCHAAICGNGVREGDEVCDGVDLHFKTCASMGYWFGGTLRCNPTCTDFDVSACDQRQYCGNDLLEEMELCDGQDLGGQTCAGLGYLGGVLSCSSDCYRVDTSRCTGQPQCGNGIAEGLEVCDGTDLRGATCEDEGFSGGTLGCDPSCQDFDTSVCSGLCGDGIREPPEVCDGNDFGGMSCGDFGYPAGALVCTKRCDRILVTGCGTWTATCGNGVREPGEQCDATDLGSSGTCAAQGFTGGVLSCDPWCRIDTSGCSGDACLRLGLYNDGRCDLCERWNGTPDPDCTQHCTQRDGVCASARDGVLGVSSCQWIYSDEDPDCSPCGDGFADAPIELCDGTDFWGHCEWFGYGTGAPLTCDASCVPDLSTCPPPP